MSYWYLLFPVVAVLLLCFSTGVCLWAFKKGRFITLEYLFWRNMVRWSVKSGHLKEELLKESRGRLRKRQYQ
ncbi:MAG: hypothetical protein R3E93_13950 [Thiothrix sp.]|uniref:Uncharacterized protein n=1 Tax=Thiothrix nivea (strain ATCC 35100 / DSM 5205 / JP2) TaxID=870187 RepID=A0A656HLQ8_THINJ|nr:hypothetical protein Thini_3758 [Thiothrix nivea DSM 5205]